ncbi:hypothetical protein FRACA_1090008 [Frankia canadensis]|uniref:biotin carboxylase n=1 Tax=Frankia canadensis TaxID=1836972 RepID=A0A2I2KJ40_9ACTN|nr:hypothetical protein FRACA_1090008 [Frankia canadensis]SOU52971.1 hypothetical protein FRACA_1090008 [Frankia canadensis]
MTTATIRFRPTPGLVTRLVLPGGPFVRVDTHLETGYRIPPFYDSLLAKIVVWAPDRAGAIARMRRALTETVVDGPGLATTAPFLRDALDHPSFRAGTHDTSLIATRWLDASTGGLCCSGHRIVGAWQPHLSRAADHTAGAPHRRGDPASAGSGGDAPFAFSRQSRRGEVGAAAALTGNQRRTWTTATVVTREGRFAGKIVSMRACGL